MGSLLSAFKNSGLASVFYGATRLPRAYLSSARILFRGFGHSRSIRSGIPVDGSGVEIPWFTYPAIEYLNQLDFSAKSVFEFGAGNSSVFWSKRAARVVTVEHDQEWCDRLRPRLPSAHELHHIKDKSLYTAPLNEPFDVIVIDGIERRACCHAAIRKLRPGGMIILDNSDWHQRCAAVLRSTGLIEIDFSGFGPVNGYTWTTSLFLHRAFAFERRTDSQPVHGIGSLGHIESD